MYLSYIWDLHLTIQDARPILTLTLVPQWREGQRDIHNLTGVKLRSI